MVVCNPKLNRNIKSLQLATEFKLATRKPFENSSNSLQSDKYTVCEGVCCITL